MLIVRVSSNKNGVWGILLERERLECSVGRVQYITKQKGREARPEVITKLPLGWNILAKKENNNNN